MVHAALTSKAAGDLKAYLQSSGVSLNGGVCEVRSSIVVLCRKTYLQALLPKLD